MRAAAAPLAGESDFIFHIGHVGSTLVARLLGLSPRIFSLREPGALRTFAQLAFELPAPESVLSQAAFDERLDVFLRLWARTYEPRPKDVDQGDQFRRRDRRGAARADAIGAGHPDDGAARGVHGDHPRRPKLAHRAQGPGAVAPAPAASPSWRSRSGAWPRCRRASSCAMSWAAEMAGLAEAAETFPDRVLWLDFERFLAAPREGLGAALSRLHGQAAPAEVEAMLTSPLFGRYSKGPEHAYDAALRRQVLDQARREHGVEIGKGQGVAGGAWRASALSREPSRPGRQPLATVRPPPSPLWGEGVGGPRVRGRAAACRPACIPRAKTASSVIPAADTPGPTFSPIEGGGRLSSRRRGLEPLRAGPRSPAKPFTAPRPSSGEALEEVEAVGRAGRGFRVVLDREHRPVLQRQAGVGAVEQRDMGLDHAARAGWRGRP